MRVFQFFFVSGPSPSPSPVKFIFDFELPGANTVDYDIGKHYMKAYYGDKSRRLIRVKDEYDPTNLFHWPQSIPLTKP